MSETQISKTQARVRPPIVVILGHVDHGKTTILDTIRKSKVAEREAGGITQHVGAYQAEHDGHKITFLDTPGHEAFSAIRSRGAKVADIAILVVAADEGVKPQTKEAIEIIKTAEIPFIVAINKIDKEGSNPQRIRQELAELSILVEDYGGQVPVVELSARKGDGIDQLLEIILLTAEVEELTCDSTIAGTGVVVESHLDKRRGTIATLVVLDGTVQLGDHIVAGATFGKIKALEDFANRAIKSASAADPIIVLGWQNPPRLGQTFQIVSSVTEAEKQATVNAATAPAGLFIKASHAPAMPQARSTKKILSLIIKSDVFGSLEAVDQVLRTIHSEEVDYSVDSYGVGAISDGDIKKAIATQSVVIGFNVEADDAALRLAERNSIRVKSFKIIYELIEYVREAMSDLLDPEIKRIPLGKLKVLAIFKKEARHQIVGGRVVSGKVLRGAMADVVRGTNALVAGRIGQLQNKKDDVTEVAEGSECGIRFDMPSMSARDIPVIIKEGDILDVYQEERIKRSI